ncbi:MAG: DUF4365 domain-containing protein [Epsilonproteobacteria bacterium]|nr:DUF4365 domain-containing protein [Campylobacterota bacterium]
MIDNTQIERIAINEVSSFFTKKLNWIVREQPILDYGIDMQLEIKSINIEDFKGIEDTVFSFNAQIDNIMLPIN